LDAILVDSHELRAVGKPALRRAGTAAMRVESPPPAIGK
jgi:hypothetical protein